MRCNFVVFMVLSLALLVTSRTALGGPIVLNFDSVPLAPCCGPGSIVDATSYLASFGVTFSPITANTFPAIQNSEGSAVVPTSSPNLFTLYGALGPQAVSYQLGFSVPLDRLSFTRAGVASNVGIVAWTATAMDAEGNVLATVGEGFSIGAGPKIFTLNGPGIFDVQFDARNDLQQTSLNAPALDDLTLNGVPEPATLTLLAIGLVLAVGARELRRRRHLDKSDF